MLDDAKDQCLDVSYVDMVSDMQNTSLDSDVAGGGRQWVWQTCTEFGYFQSSGTLLLIILHPNASAHWVHYVKTNPDTVLHVCT